MNRKAAVALITIFLFAVTTAVFFPGSYSIDSWNHYGQVVSGNYSDWHSPLMPFTWKILYLITGKFSAMYLFQMTLYWLLFYLILKEAKNRFIFLPAIFLSLAFLFIPQYVMKDVHVALSWGLAFVLLFISSESTQEKLKWLVFPLILYGLWMRVNTILAIMPAIYLFVEMYGLRAAKTWKKLTVTVLLSLVSVGGYFVFTYTLLDATRQYPEYKLMLQDIVGISKVSGVDYMPSCISSDKEYQEDSVLRLYHPASFDHIFWPLSGRLVPDATEQNMACLNKSWKLAIREHPLIYLGNRTEGFFYYLRIKKRFVSTGYWNFTYYIEKNSLLEVHSEGNRMARLLVRTWFYLCETIFYEPWLWLLLNVTLFILFRRRFLIRKKYTDKIMSFMQLSGLLFLFSQFPVYQHDRDFRYNYWIVIVVITGFIFYFRKGPNHETEASKNNQDQVL